MIVYEDALMIKESIFGLKKIKGIIGSHQFKKSAFVVQKYAKKN